MAHVDDVVAPTIRPDRHPATTANLQPLWLLIGGLGSLAFCLCLSLWLFPPDIGVGTPTINYEPDRFVVISRIVNHTIHPVALNLRFKLVAATAGSRGQIRARTYAAKNIALTIPGTADAMARCEFFRDNSLPDAPAAEVEILSR